MKEIIAIKEVTQFKSRAEEFSPYFYGHYYLLFQESSRVCHIPNYFSY